jgi:ribosomal protein S19
LPFVFKSFNCHDLKNREYNFISGVDFLRNSLIVKALEGEKVLIYNGRAFCLVKVTRGMIGHKFGEFAVTKVLGSEFREALRSRKRKKKKK